MRNFSEMNVLLIDEYKTMLRVIEHLMRQIGFIYVDTAAEREQALQKVSEKKYDLVLLDWHMETLSGAEFLQYVKQKQKYIHFPPFIAITSERKIKEALADVDENACIIRPFNAAMLREKVSTVLAEM